MAGETAAEAMDANAYNGSGLNAFLIAGAVIISVAVFLRFWSRKMQHIPMKADDWTLLVALILTLGSATTYLVMSIHFGLGRHFATLPTWKQVAFAKTDFAFNLTYTTSYPLSRISLVLLYQRIFVQTWFRVFTWFMIGCYVCYMIATFIVDINWTTPVSAYWNQVLGPQYAPTHSVNQVHLYLANAIFNIATDLILLAAAIFIIWRLQMSKKNKFGLSFVFCLGTLTLVASIVRLVYFFQVDPKDNTWTLTNLAWWTAVEQYLGILCPCLLTFRPIIATFYDIVSHHASAFTSSMRTRPKLSGETARQNTDMISTDKQGSRVQGDNSWPLGQDVAVGANGQLNEKVSGETLTDEHDRKNLDLESGFGPAPDLTPFSVSEKQADGHHMHNNMDSTAQQITATEMPHQRHQHNSIRLDRGEDGMAVDQDLALASLDPTAVRPQAQNRGSGVYSTHATAYADKN